MPAYKPYSIQKLDNHSVYVIPKDYRGIDYVLPFVNLELKAKKFTGNVVFDLLLSNGNNRRRFFSSFFDGATINPNSLSTISSQTDHFVRISNKFIKLHPQILTQGILRSVDIEEFKQKLNLKED